MAVEARRRSLRKLIKYRCCPTFQSHSRFLEVLQHQPCFFCRQCNRMRSAMAALALHALKPRMETVMTELVGTVALRKNLSQGRQRRAFNAWLQVASVMHWRRDRMQTLCWLSWQAETVAARSTLRKSKHHYQGVLVRRGMTAWKVVYTQVTTLLSSIVQSTKSGKAIV